MESRAPAYLCYKEKPVEFMLLRLEGTSPEEFEKFTLDLAREHGVDPSTTHLIRVDRMTQEEIEGMMRSLGLITSKNEREVLADIGNLGVP